MIDLPTRIETGFICTLATALFFLTMPMRCLYEGQLQRAVDHGAASWVVDQKTGETKFKWKDEVK